jgi:transcriptional regulator of acetoin/glycerol metabolism
MAVLLVGLYPRGSLVHRKQGRGRGPKSGGGGQLARPAKMSLKDKERSHIRQVLEENDWNIVRSAKLLEIDRTTLYSKIKKYDLQKDG